jgi:hypothetical protein
VPLSDSQASAGAGPKSKGWRAAGGYWGAGGNQHMSGVFISFLHHHFTIAAFGFCYAQHRLHEVEVYAHAKAIRTDSGVVEAIEITYMTLYAHNGPYCIAGLCNMGAHDGDWEHITARVDPGSGDLQGMWYNSHRSRDGEWVEGGAVHRRGGRPVAYVALHGHGLYPRVSMGTWDAVCIFYRDQFRAHCMWRVREGL